MKVKFLGKRKRVVHVVRFVKAVSTVVAVLLMIAIAVIASLVAYFWVTGYFKSTSTKISKAIQIQNAYYTGQYLGVYVQNIGQGKATLIANQCLYVDGALRTSAGINPGKLQQISYTLQESDIALVVDAISLNLGQTIKIKIVTSEGTFVEYSFTINTFQGQNPYSLTLIADPPAGGSVSANNNGPYHYGDVVQLTATANSGWAFSGWSGDASGSTTPTTIVINGTNTVTASFTQNTYAITVTVDPSVAGSWTPDSSPPYHYGDVVTLSASPNSGYAFSGWSGDGVAGAGGTWVVTVTGNMAVTASFTQNTYTITVTVLQSPAAGTVTPDVPPPYHYGDVVTLTESSADGYAFSSWSDDGSGTGTTCQVTVTRDMTVTANFVQSEYSLTLNVNPPAGGSVSADKNPPYHYGDVVTLTESSADGYAFSSWSDDGSGTGTTCQVTVTRDMTVTATFTLSEYSITVNVNPSGAGTVTPDVPPPYHYGDVVTLSASPNSGYAFSGWSEDGVAGAGGTWVVTVTGNMAVTATFTQIEYTLTVGTIGNGAGTVTKTPDQATYHYGDSVQLNALANAGSYFAGWSGDLSGTTNPVSITIDGNKTVSATFSATAVSSVSVSPPTATITAGGTQAYTATASDAYGYTWDVTGSATWSITSGAGGSWLANVYTSAKAGTWTVTASYSGKSGTAQLTVNAAAASKLVYAAGTIQSLTVGQVSSVITVQIQDSYGNPVTTGSAITVSLSTNSTGYNGGRFTSDAAGNRQITSVTINAGSSSASFYYYDNTRGSPVLTASATGLTSATTQFTINSYYLDFRTGGGQTLATGQVSSSISVRRYQSDGSSYYGTTTITVALTTNSSGGHFSLNSDGSGTITSVTITSGNRDSSTFYYVDSAVGTPVLTASSAGYTSGQTTFTIRMPILVFSAGASQTLTAGSISARITVQRQDGSGNAYAPSAAIIVNLVSSSVTGVFYSDAAGTQVITQITIASGADHAYVYYKDTTVGSPTLTASSTGYAPATTTFTMYAAGTKLVFTAGASQTLTRNAVSSVITVQLQDAGGSPILAIGAVTVSLSSSSSGGGFYSDAGGTNQITSVTIASGASSASFYYADSSAGTPTLTASSGSFTPATTVFTINSYQLAFSAGAPQTLTAGSVSARITVQRQDRYGNAYAPSTAIIVNLVSSSVTGVFYSDAAGTQVITQITIASGADHAYVYYKDTTVGSPTLMASTTTAGYTSATTTFTIKMPVLVFSAGASQTLTAGSISAQITVQRQDGSGNVYSPNTAITVNLVSSSVTGVFYSNSSGTQVITSVTIASGASSANFYYKDTTVGSPTLTASSTGYTPATTTFMILASGAKLVFTAGAGQTLTASTVSSVITVQLQDSGGNPISAGAGGVVVSLSTNSSNGRFYSDFAGNNRITSVTIASGASSANFYYWDSSAGHPTLTASSGSLTSATTQFTINSYYLGFRTGGGQTLATGQVSSSITVRRYNPDGSSYNGPAITVALTTNSSGGHFCSNSDGSGTMTSVTITNGNHDSSTFYYVDSAVGTPVLTASSAGYTSGQTTFTITGPASKLVFTAGTSQSLYTNTVSSVITVQRQDAAGYGVTSGGSITVSLAKTSTTGSFYNNPDGTGSAITQIAIASGSSSANFYYKDTAAGSSTITASSGSLTSATTTFTITLNQVPNGGFESSGVWTTGGTGYATSQDTDETNIPPHSGIFAELDSAYQTATEYGSLINTFSPAIALSSIPNTAGSLSTWVYNNGHNGVAVGYYSFQIALTASDGTQLIYWWGNTPANAPTETANTKVINMGTLPGMFTVGQWIQFSRNLPADWASKGLSPSTSITSITIRNDGYYSGGNQYGQEIFIDDVQIQ